MSSTTKSEPLDLTGRPLIAMPGMGDPRFEKSVVFLCAHSSDGAMGIIINKPTEEIRLKDLTEQLEIPQASEARDFVVHYGGPVEPGRGFVLHSGDYTSDLATLEVSDDFGMTATLDVLEEFAAGRGPNKATIALGYSGWGPGQLEGEILANGWLTCDASPDLVFENDDADKWEAALKTLGVDALMLSASAGRA